MKLDVVKVGNLQCNCYILSKGNDVLVIDPGDNVDRIIGKICNKNVVGILITHHHFDHVGGIEELIDKYKCNVYDRYNLLEGLNNINNFTFEVIYTPGHKEDLITFYFKENKWMFCGDFIFKDSIGRCDLEGSNINDMVKSINRIKNYDRDIIIYPGHGDSTILGYEIDNNIYFRDMEIL